MFVIGIIVICIVGTLLHFVYEWSHHNKVVAVFAAVNESTWEHIKICMTPTILWSIYDIIKYGFDGNFILAKSLSLLTIILLIPILFYSYTAFTKKSILIIDVICFYITVICSQIVFHYFINTNPLPYIYTYISAILLFIEVAAYLFLTFQPQKNFVFEDPISHKYGLEGHTELDHHHHH
jgi:hypothetical protein